MSLDLGELSGQITYDTTPMQRALQEARRVIADQQAYMARAGTQSGQAYGDGIYRGADGRLRNARHQFVSEADAIGRQTGDAMGSAGERAADEGGGRVAAGFKKGLKGGAAGIAVTAAAIGATAGASLMEGMDREFITDRLDGALGNPEMAARNAKVTAQIYNDAYGESFDQIAEAVEAVRTTIDDFGSRQGKGIRAITEEALDFSKALGLEVPRSVQIAQQMVVNELAPSVSDAFDLMLAGSRRVPLALREDLADALDEYGPFAAALGMSGEQIVSALAAGSDQGMYGIDKYGDAIKEFTIRSTDMSTGSVAAYKKIGLSAREMSNDILAGGPRAKSAFDQVVRGLLAIEDPAKRANTAIALFGTPVEDLGVMKIPEFLRSLRDGESALGDWEGATEAAGATMGDNATTNITKFKRSVQTELVDFIGGEVLPALNDWTDNLNEKAGPAGDRIAETWEKAGPKIGSVIGWLANDVFPNVVDGWSRISQAGVEFWEDVSSSFDEHPELRDAFGEMIEGGKWLIENIFPGIATAAETVLPILADGIGVALDVTEQLAMGFTYVAEYGAKAASLILEAFGWAFNQILDFASASLGWVFDLLGKEDPFDKAIENFYRFQQEANGTLDTIVDGALVMRETLQEEITPEVNVDPAMAAINRLNTMMPGGDIIGGRPQPGGEVHLNPAYDDPTDDEPRRRRRRRGGGGGEGDDDGGGDTVIYAHVQPRDVEDLERELLERADRQRGRTNVSGSRR